MNAFDVQHRVTHAQRAGAEAGDVAARLERIGRDLGAVEDLQPVADRVVEGDQAGDAPLVGERAGAARHLHAGLFEPRGKSVDGGGVRDLPAEKADALAAVRDHDDALLAVVHAEGEVAAAFIDELKP